MPLVLVPDDVTSRRLRFMLRAVSRRYGDPTVLWVNRGMPAEEAAQTVAHVARQIPDVAVDWRIISRSSLKAALPAVRRELKQASGPIVSMGFASLPFARAAGVVPDIWVVRGIPEELAMHNPTHLARLQAWSRWKLAWLAGRPKLAIGTSNPMERMLAARTRAHRAVAIPNTVDVSVFAPPSVGAPERTYLTYLGSGAPWQGMDLLEETWAELARLDPRLRFRIISRDERVQRVAARIGDQVQVVGASSPRAVAELLWEAKAAFLLRRPDVVNEVSIPVKFGEYLASGVPVIANDLGWDVTQIIRDSGAGIVVQSSDSPRQIAEQVLEFMAPGIGLAQTQPAAVRLDERMWLDRLVAMLP